MTQVPDTVVAGDDEIDDPTTVLFLEYNEWLRTSVSLREARQIRRALLADPRAAQIDREELMARFDVAAQLHRHGREARRLQNQLFGKLGGTVLAPARWR